MFYRLNPWKSSSQKCLIATLLHLVFSQGLYAQEPTPLVASNWNTACFADGIVGNGVHCLAPSNSEASAIINSIPKIEGRVIKLAVSARMACALYVESQTDSTHRSVQCWGDPRRVADFQKAFPKTNEIVDIEATPFSTCAVQVSGSALSITYEQADMTCITPAGVSTKRLDQFSATSRDRQAEFAVDYPLSANAPGLKCVVNATNKRKVSCQSESKFEVDAPEDIVAITTTGRSVCGLTSAEMFCWNQAKQKLEVSTNSGLYLKRDLSVKHPSDIRGVLQILKSYVYSFDQDFFVECLYILSQSTDRQLVLATEAFQNYFTGFSYGRVQTQRMLNLRPSFEEFLKAHAIDIQNIEASDRAVLIRLLVSSLTTAKSVMLRVGTDASSASQVQKTEQFVRELGQLILAEQSLSADARQALTDFVQELTLNQYISARVPMMMSIIDRI
ncbi:MAG: hypothetical protein NTV34_21715 [Proteobacteria bacterium]|nr:hypothetical protein [Pseudomonadota bacterium]